MNLRIPNLFKNIKSKLFRKEVEDEKIAEEKKAEIVKNARITHGGNQTNPKYRSHRHKLGSRKKSMRDTMRKANFGTFSPVKYF